MLLYKAVEAALMHTVHTRNRRLQKIGRANSLFSLLSLDWMVEGATLGFAILVNKLVVRAHPC